MKSSKKRCKQLLKKIDQSAHELISLCAGLNLLNELRENLERITNAGDALNRRAAELTKMEFSAAMADDEALNTLEELLDADAVGALEERLFAALNNQADSELGEFLQQLLEKIDRRYSELSRHIQQLLAVLADGES